MNSLCHNKYICNQQKEITKNHFQSYPICISVTLSKISLRPHPLLKSVSSENKRVQRNDVLSCETYLSINLSKIKYLPPTLVKTVSAKSYFFGYKTFRNFWAIKVNESLKTILYLLHYVSLQKYVNFKTDDAQFSKFCLVKCAILLEKVHFQIFRNLNI